MARKKNSSSSSKRRTNAKSKTTRGGTRSRRSSKKSSSSSKRSQQQIKLDRQQKALMGGIAIVVITGVLVLSLLSPNQGQLTSALSGLMRRLFGLGSIALPLVTGGIGVYLILWGMDQPARISPFRLTGAALLFIVLETAASLWMLVRPNAYVDVWSIARDGEGGGYFGGLFTYALSESIGTLGAIFTMMVLVVVGTILVIGLTREQMSDYMQRAAAWVKDTWAQLREPPPREIPINNGRSRTAPQRETAVREAAVVQPSLLPEETDTAEEPAPSKPQTQPKREPRRSEPKPPPTAAEPTVVTPIVLGNRGASRQHQWRLPALGEMLEPGMDQDGSSATIREQVETIEHTLDSFGAPATVVEINQGPTITQFGVEPNFIETRGGKRTKVKVGKIASLADDLALALAAASIRIQAPVPGKGYVGIEVPNPAKALVSLRDVMETADFQKVANKSLLAIGLGQDVGGQPIVADLTQMPHLLIAGTTGSGKSVCVNSIIACLLLRNTPDTLKLVMVDPKRVELTGYNGIPHLAAPVIVEIDKVIGMLQWALREMDNRYKMFAEIGARNIEDFNKKVHRHRKLEPLPYVVIIIDELADLMMLSPEDTERSITRLAQLARATGMHMVIATQRPSVDVVTGLIKANFPARVAFAVASGTDSRVILDTTGAERLLGQGDMLYQSPDAAAAVRSQGCFVSDGELSKLIAYWQRARRFNIIPAEESVQPRQAAAQSAAPAAPVQKPAPAAAPQREDKPAPPQKTAPPVAAPRINLDKQDKPDPNEAETIVVPPVQRTEPERPSPPPPLADDKMASQQPLWEALQAEDEEDDLPELDDDLLPEAIEMVRQMNKASTSLLQRRFRIGYTRAARIIDYMEEAGIIGPPTGTSKAREVLPADGAENGDETAVSHAPSDDA